MFDQIPSGSQYSALCPHCNKVISSASVIIMNMCCPLCGKFMSKKDIIYAPDPNMSYELACVMQKEREKKEDVVSETVL